MNVAILMFDRAGYEYQMGGIASMLLRAGHKVASCYPGAAPPSNRAVKHIDAHWAWFDLGELEAFKPDRILMFNGSHGWAHAANQEISRRWPTIYFENGWLPQKGNLSIDSFGCGVYGKTAWTKDLKNNYPNRTKRLMRYLRAIYKPKSPPPNLPRDYILVPLQLEGDTSILYGSPRFKTMQSFVSFVRRKLPGNPIVVKPHPLDKSQPSWSNVTMVDSKVPFNDLVPGARAIVGINSTTLVEYLVHLKPIAALGISVASHKGVFYEGSEAFENLPGILNFKPDPEAIGTALHYLYYRQFRYNTPPPRILRYIEGGPESRY